MIDQTPTGMGGDGSGGTTVIGEVLSLIHTVADDITKSIMSAERMGFMGVVDALFQHGAHFAGLGEAIGGDLYSFIAEHFTGEFYSKMLELGLGVDIGQFDKDAMQGVKTTDSMLAFAYTMPWVVAAVGLTGKIPLAGRFIETLLEPISKLPEEMGLSWALGMQIEEAYAAAVGQSIEEGIKEQKRSTRVEWPILRQAFRQHLMDDRTLEEWLGKLGYPSDQITFIKSLDTHQLGVADLQRLWLGGEMSRSDFRQYLQKLGFTESDINLLTHLYIDKAETQAGAMYRNVARNLFAQQLISEGQYRGILGDTHTPEREIEDDVKAVLLERQTGHLQASVSVLKSRYQHGADPTQIKTQLSQLGYTPDAIADILKAWDAGPTPHTLSVAKILSYYISGVLTDKNDVRKRLIAAHLRPDDADFLIAHPQSTAKVKSHPLTPGLVIQAYLAGAIEQHDVLPKLKDLHVDDDAATYMLETAQWRKSRQKKPKGTTIPLTKAEIVDAWYVGAMSQPDALDALQHLGYTFDDAVIIMEIKNKGPLQPEGPVLQTGMSFDQALAFLESLGYSITPPPDPRISVAEQIIGREGYYATPPVNPRDPGVPLPPPITIPRPTPQPPVLPGQ